MQSLLWLQAPCLFTSNFPGAAERRLQPSEEDLREAWDERVAIIVADGHLTLC